MNGGPYVGDRGVPEDVHLAGLRVHLHVHYVSGKRCPNPFWTYRSAGYDGASGVQQPRCQLLEGQALLGVGRVPELPVGELHLVCRSLPYQRRSLLHLPHHVVGGLIGCPAGGEGGTASAGDRRVPDSAGVAYDGVNVLSPDSQHLGGVHRCSRSRAANVHRPRHLVHCPVVVDAQCCA